MTMKKGKITFTGLLFLLVLIYGGYLGVQLLSASFSERQIKTEVHDVIGMLRGPGFTQEQGKEAIVKILKKKGVIFDQEHEEAISFRINEQHKKIEYYFEYGVEINWLFKIEYRYVEIEDVVDNL